MEIHEDEYEGRLSQKHTFEATAFGSVWRDFLLRRTPVHASAVCDTEASSLFLHIAFEKQDNVFENRRVIY